MMESAEVKSDGAYVYILPHIEHQRFKIGKANDVHRRMGSIGDVFDLSQSKSIKLNNADAAYNLERALHRCFDKWRIPALEIAEQDGGKLSGYTEWFQSGCLTKLLSFVESNKELFDYDCVEPLRVIETKSKTGQPHKKRLNAAPTINHYENGIVAVNCICELLKGLTALNLVEHKSFDGISSSLIAYTTFDNEEGVIRQLTEIYEQGIVKIPSGGFSLIGSYETREYNGLFAYRIQLHDRLHTRMDEDSVKVFDAFANMVKELEWKKT